MDAHAHIRVRLARAPKNFERRVHVGALLHVNPEGLFRRAMLEEFGNVRKAECAVEVQAKLCELHGNFRGQPGRANPLENLKIMLRDAFGFGAVGDVFAQMRQHRRDAVLGQRARGLECILHLFAGHEALGRPAEKSILRRALPQPFALRGNQDGPARQSHAQSPVPVPACGEESAFTRR